MTAPFKVDQGVGVVDRSVSWHLVNTVRMPKALIVALTVLAVTGCRNALLDTPQPVVRSALELHTRTVTTDTVQLTIGLSTGPVRALGSLTATLATEAEWRFVGCAAAQGEPLLACKAHERSVRLAAAWAAGTHVGDLLVLTFVRMSPVAQPAWQLTVQEAHGVGGQSLLDDLDVRTDPVPAAGAP